MFSLFSGRWHDISNVVNHKRVFNIECTVPERSVGFTLPDADTGRYFWKLCVLQHTFFMKYEQNQVHPSVEPNLNLFQNVPEDLNESRDNLFIEQSTIYASDPHLPSSFMWSPQQNQLPQQQQQHQQQLQAESVVSSNISLATSQQQLRGLIEPNWTPVPGDYSSHRNSNWALVGSNTSLNNNRMQSTSCLDFSNNNNVQQDRERLKAFLPGYRQAPDYETAVQQKYRSSETSLLQSQNNVNIYSGSQPDVHRATAITDAIFGQQLQQKYPDVTQTTNPVYQQQFDPNYVAANVDGRSHPLQLMHFNKPPPPYQANRLSSTSTPDLASHRAMLGYRGAYVSGSSPDLVSTRTFLNPQFMSQQQVYPPSQSQTFRYRYSQNIVPHGTYENLNFVDPHPKTNLLTQKMQQPNAFRPQSTLKSGGSQHLNGSIEPIYENIPLPWQNETPPQPTEMRDRASSIQSAPGVMRFKSPLPQPHQQTLNESNNVTISNTSLTTTNGAPTINDAKNNNFVEHRILTKTTSNPIVQHSHDIADGGDGSTIITVNATTTSAMTAPTSEIIQPPEPFKQQKPIHKTKIEITAASHNESITSSSNRSHLDTSQTSTFTNKTATTNDSGVSVGQKEKKKKRWGFFGGGGGSSKSSDKLKSATLGRDKDKSSSKSGTLTREEETNLKHRWSTGLPRLQPLAATISKEKLVRISIQTIHIIFFLQFSIFSFVSCSHKFSKKNCTTRNCTWNLNVYRNGRTTLTMTALCTKKTVRKISIRIFCRTMTIVCGSHRHAKIAWAM